MICTECSGCHFLRHLYIPSRLQQTIESARSCRGFREEEVQSIELTHVSNPVRFEDGLPSCDRQRVESSHGPLCIFLQIVEVRSFVPVSDAIEDAQMKFKRFLNLIENAADAGSTSVSGHFL